MRELRRSARRTRLTLTRRRTTFLPRRSRTVAWRTRPGLIPFGLNVIAFSALWTGRYALTDAAAGAAGKASRSMRPRVAAVAVAARRGAEGV
jgi:hypothetical protein